jgi:hypothetical protein
MGGRYPGLKVLAPAASGGDARHSLITEESIVKKRIASGLAAVGLAAALTIAVAGAAAARIYFGGH